jgi:hypothetical protein
MLTFVLIVLCKAEERNFVGFRVPARYRYGKIASLNWAKPRPHPFQLLNLRDCHTFQTIIVEENSILVPTTPTISHLVDPKLQRDLSQLWHQKPAVEQVRTSRTTMQMLSERLVVTSL